jgi:CHAD domain-containing protein
MHNGKPTDRSEAETVWLLPPGQQTLPDDLGLTLSGVLVPLRPRREWLTFFDTYDWELHFSGLVLLQADGRLLLCRPGGCSSDSALAVLPWKGLPPASVTALGDSALRREVESVAELRALLPVARACRLVQPTEYRDAAGIVVLGLRLESFYRTKRCAEPFLTVLRLSPRQGSAADQREFCNRLLEVGLQVVDAVSRGAVLPHLCALPRHEEIQPRLQHPPSAPCRQAVFDLAAAMLTATRHYEAGIAAGVEIECLHRYRVLLRRTRSLLGLMKGVLPSDDMQVLRLELARIAARTNRLRDLDVFLASLPDYEALLPEPLRPGLAGVTAQARRERGLERGRVLSLLRSRDYASRLARLAATFAAPDDYPPTPLAGEALGQAIRQRLWRQCRSVVKTIPAVRTSATADGYLHRLRLRVKRARYLLEIFGGLFDPDAVNLLAARCRQLQAVLGEVCDLGAQQEHVMGLLERRGSAAASVHETAAVGALAGALFARQKQARKAVTRQLERFLGRKTRLAIRHFRAADAETAIP